MFNGKNKNAFTLVEIVIIVFIIIILTSVAFFSYSGYSSKAKDTVKIKDIANISEIIDFDLLNGGELSKPDSIVSENTTLDIPGYDFGDTVWYEGQFGKENISKFPSLSFGSLKNEYKYYLSKNLDYYVIEAELASGEKVIKTNYTIKNTLANNITNPTTPETGNQGGGTPETGNQGGGTPETGNTSPANNLPNITGFSGDEIIYTDIRFLLTAQVNDPDGDTVTISSQNLPSGVTIDGLNISGKIETAGTHNFDLKISDGKGEKTISLPIYVQALPRYSSCYINLYDSSAWLSFNSSGHLSNDSAFVVYVKNYWNYRVNEIYDLVNQKYSAGNYQRINFGGPDCYFDNAEAWGP